jgi:peptidoglycan/LPS O-acetylase OafA/YrhL
MTSRIEGIDGLRAIAVLAVVAYHFDVGWLQGGFLGVDLFMVISGFLITRSLLAMESDRRRFANFYMRRVRRLLPAVIVFVPVVVVATVLTTPRITHTPLRFDALWSIAYGANWRFIATHASYFNTVDAPSPLRHLWSLGIEEQFYIAWPFLLFIVFRRHRRTAIAALFILSALLMVKFSSQIDPFRAYYGTDTRAQALLAGCFVALVNVDGKAFKKSLIRSRSVAFPVGFGFILALFAISRADATWMYRGGFSVVAVVGGLLVWLLVSDPAPAVSRYLTNPTLTAIGKRSYSIYLWHWPIITLVNHRYVAWHSAVIFVVRMILIILFAEVSYQIIEERLRGVGQRTKSYVAAVSVGALLAGSITWIATVRAESVPSYLSGKSGVETITAENQPSAHQFFVRVIGDSIVESLKPGFEVAAKKLGINIEVVVISGCGLLAGKTMGDNGEIYAPSEACPATVESVLSSVDSTRSADLLIWMNAWDAQSRVINGRQLVIGRNDRALVQLIRQKANDLKQFGQRVVVVATPERAFTSAVIPDAPEGREKERFRRAIRNVLVAGRPPDDDIYAVDPSLFVCGSKSPCPDVSAGGNRFRPSDGIHYEGAEVENVARWLIERAVEVASIP